jgi:hypothetical protein
MAESSGTVVEISANEHEVIGLLPVTGKPP